MRNVLSAFLCLLTVVNVFATDADRLGKDLTPIGAIRAGNKDNSIPMWQADKFTAKQHQQWLQDIEKEKPLYTITSNNHKKYEGMLSDGLKNFFENHPNTFYMPVYKSHRTALQPQWTYDNARKNVANAKLSDSGDEILQAYAGTPFPIPETAQQIIWNHQTRWKGVFINLHLYEITVFPNLVKDSLETNIETYAVFYDPNRTTPELNWRNTYYFSYILGPSRLAGGGLLIHESLQPKRKPRQSWIYVAGERRMRRMPVMGYDAPLFNAEAIRVADEIDIFNGPLDRYDWTLKGRREMLIPYNNQKMRYNRCDDENALNPYHITPNAMRFEKHRVWVVEANLKAGQRHTYKRRIFYIDEDTWSIALVDIYDKHDELYRFTMRFSAYYEEMPGTFSALDAYHDLQKGSYFLQCSAGGGTSFSQQPPPNGYFSPTNIRQRYKR